MLLSASPVVVAQAARVRRAIAMTIRFMARSFSLLLALLQFGCTSPTAPITSATKAYGRLSGIVTIGPICPVQRDDTPCPTPPSGYSARNDLVLDEQARKIPFTVDIQAQGLYVVDVVP